MTPGDVHLNEPIGLVNAAESLSRLTEASTKNLGQRINKAYEKVLTNATIPAVKKEIEITNYVDRLMQDLPDIPLLSGIVRAYIPGIRAHFALAGFDPKSGEYKPNLPVLQRIRDAAAFAGEAIKQQLLLVIEAVGVNTAEMNFVGQSGILNKAKTESDLLNLIPQALKKVAEASKNPELKNLLMAAASAQEILQADPAIGKAMENTIVKENLPKKISEKLSSQQPEAKRTAENKTVRGESASQVVKNYDAACDGQNVKLGFVEKDSKGADNQDKDTQVKALADKLGITAGEIYKLQDQVRELTDPQTGQFAGIYSVFLGWENNPEVSSIANIVFLKILSKKIQANPQVTSWEIIQSGMQEVDKTLKSLYPSLFQNQSLRDLKVAISLVDRDGNMYSLERNEARVVVIGRQGNIKDSEVESSGFTSETGSEEIKKVQLTSTDKIVLSSKDKIKTLTDKLGLDGKTPEPKQMVDFIAKSGESASAGETIIEEARSAQNISENNNVPPSAPVDENIDEQQTDNSSSATEEKREKDYDSDYPYYADLPDGESLEGIEKKLIRTKTVIDPKTGTTSQVEVNYLVEVDGLLEKAKKLFPRNQQESEYAYIYRLLSELEDRVRFPNKWKDPAKQDDLYRETKIKTDQEVLLMAVEAKMAFNDREENQRVLKESDGGEELHRREVHTEVSHNTAVAQVNDRLQKYFKEKGTSSELPEDDLSSFTLIADILMDVKDQSLGELGSTYREAFKKLESDAKTNPVSNRKLLELRRYFYLNALDALASRELTIPTQPAAINQKKVLQDMRTLIQNLEYSISQGTSSDLLIAAYKGVTNEASEKTKEKIKALLEKYPQVIIDMALKGGDLMQRRSRYESPKLHDVPDKIHKKKFVQGPEEETQATQKVPPKQVTGQPSPAPTGSQPNGEEPHGTKPVRPSPAPASGQPGDKPEGKMPPAPSEHGKEPVRPREPFKETELRAAVVSAQQRIEHNNENQKVLGMQVLEERRREMARIIMNEDRKKWEGRAAWLKQLLPRFWKYTFGDTATYAKESSHGLKLLAASGINVTTLPYDLFKDIDQLARENVRSSRVKQGGRFTGWLKDAAHELTFTERDLHKERIKIVEALRTSVEDPESASSKAFRQELQKTNRLGLLDRFNVVLAEDLRAGEKLAQRMNTEFGSELIHKAVGETMEKGLTFSTPEGKKVEKFFKDYVIGKLLLYGVRNNGIPQEIFLQVNREMQNYFLSKEFINWLDSLPDNQRKSFKESLSTVSDIAAITRDVLLPQVLQSWEQAKSTLQVEDYVRDTLQPKLESLELSINIGTLEAGQKGIINEGIIERLTARGVTNARVHALYERVRATQGPVYTPPAPPVTKQQNLAEEQYQNYMNAAVQRSSVISGIATLGTNNVVMGLGTGIGLYAARVTLGGMGRIAVPVLGGSAVSGVFRAIQEHRLFTREWEEHGVERELNYKFPRDGRRRDEMQRLELHTRQMQSELTDPMQGIITKVNKGEASDQEVLQLMGLVADTEARMEFADIRGERGLFRATEPQSYQVEKFNLEIAKAWARVGLHKLLDNDTAKLAEFVNKLGITFPATGPNLPQNDNDRVNYILDVLRDALVQNIQNGTQATAKQQLALGNLSIDQAMSVDAREREFRIVRARRDVNAVTTTLIAGGASAILSEAASDLLHRAFSAASSISIPQLKIGINAAGLVHQEMPTGTNIVEINDHLKLNLPMGYHVDGIDSARHVIFVADAHNSITNLSYTDDQTGGHITGILSGSKSFNLVEQNKISVDHTILSTESQLNVPAGNPAQEVAGIKFNLPSNYHVTQTPNGLITINDGKLDHQFSLSHDALNKPILTPINHDETLVPHTSEVVGPPGTPITNSSQIEQMWKDQGLEKRPDGVQFWTNRTSFSDYQELRGYDQIYQSGSDYGIVFDASKMGQTLNVQTGQWVKVDTLVQSSPLQKMQFTFQLGGHHDHLKVDANFGNAKLILDPNRNDSVKDVLYRDGQTISWKGPTGSDPSHAMTIGELSRMVLNQNQIKNVVNDSSLKIHPGTSPETAGSLASEWLENFKPGSHGASIFNLAVNGKQGNISFGFTNEKGTFNYLANMSAKHAVEISPPPQVKESLFNFGIHDVKDVPVNQVDLSTTIYDSAPRIEIGKAANIGINPEDIYIPVLIPLSRRPLEAPEGVFETATHWRPGYYGYGQTHQRPFTPAGYGYGQTTQRSFSSSDFGYGQTKQRPFGYGYGQTAQKTFSEEQQSVEESVKVEEQDALQEAESTINEPWPETQGSIGDVNAYIKMLRERGYYPARFRTYVKNQQGVLVNKDGSPIIRDIQLEKSHINEYLTSLDPNYRSEINGYANKMNPMDIECRVAIMIPAFHEGKNIYHTLDEWAKQRTTDGKLLDKSTYEIDVIVNGPKGYQKDNTYDEVMRFKREHSDVKVNVIDVEIDSERGNVGMARKILTDTILQRSVARPQQKGALFIESEDADLLEIDEKAIIRIINRIDGNPYIDALRGKQDLSPKIIMENDYLFFDRRVDRLFEYLLRDYRLRPELNIDFDFNWNRVTTGGWNTGFTADVYALIGGYIPDPVGEDMNIGERISILRGEYGPDGRFNPNVRTVEAIHNVGQSNPRRFIHALLRRIGPYADFTNPNINEEIRQMGLQEMMDKLNYGKRISEDNVQLFNEILTGCRRYIADKVQDEKMRNILFHRLILAMGFSKYKLITNPDGSITKINGLLKQEGVDKKEWKRDYHIDQDGSVKIDNIDNIKKALEDYREKNKS